MALVKGPRDHFIMGAWNCRCDECGRKRKSFEMSQRWDGLMVCQTCWEPRQPQDFVRGVPDGQPPPWTRPSPPEVFIDPADPVLPEDL